VPPTAQAAATTSDTTCRRTCNGTRKDSRKQPGGCKTTCGHSIGDMANWPALRTKVLGSTLTQTYRHSVTITANLQDSSSLLCRLPYYRTEFKQQMTLQTSRQQPSWQASHQHCGCVCRTCTSRAAVCSVTGQEPGALSGSPAWPLPCSPCHQVAPAR
jgi:hypothetical protein